jgi:hypothetical protein
MGLCMCTMVSCPIGSCVGGVFGGCLNPSDEATKKGLLGIFSAIFAAGCICYIILIIKCADADSKGWNNGHVLTEGECWSEGGRGPFMSLGLLTGALMGVGFSGLTVMLIRMLCQIHRTKELNTDLLGKYNEHIV